MATDLRKLPGLRGRPGLDYGPPPPSSEERNGEKKKRSWLGLRRSKTDFSRVNESFRIGYINLDKEMEGNLVNRI